MSVQAQLRPNSLTEDQRISAAGMEVQTFLPHRSLAIVDDPQQMHQGALASQKILYPVAASPYVTAPVGPGSTLLSNFGLFQKPQKPELNNTLIAAATSTRKRRKEANTEARQQLQQQQPAALQLVDLNQTHGCVARSGVVSTGLHLAFDDEHSTVTNSRPEARSLVRMAHKDEISTQLMRQQEELNQLIKLQAEHFRQLLLEQAQRHSKSLLFMMDEASSRHVREKDLEIERMIKRSMELEERIKQLNLEIHMWQSKAKNNESIVAVLRTNLQQAAQQGREHSRMEGCGDSEADDAASAHVDENAGVQQARAITMMMKSGQERIPARCCKRCGLKEVSILLIPCMHLCLCNDCKVEAEKCPICNIHSSAHVEVYLS